MLFVFFVGFLVGCWFTDSFPDTVSIQIDRVKKFLGVENKS